ncbi:unnamed protein product, partial [Phaeothamnion confervicola]
IGDVFNSLVKQYHRTTPRKVKLLDAFLVYVATTGVLVAAYSIVGGSFPFNSFLASFLCTVGVFVLTVSLRLQVDASNMAKRSPERAFADYVICNLILFLVVFNFMG